jgi:hypothetical protein
MFEFRASVTLVDAFGREVSEKSLESFEGLSEHAATSTRRVEMDLDSLRHTHQDIRQDLDGSREISREALEV